MVLLASAEPVSTGSRLAVMTPVPVRPAPVPTVDSSAEERRLQENEALGQPVTNGATPQDSNQPQGFFSRLFGWF